MYTKKKVDKTLVYLKNDNKVRVYTGLPNKSAFNDLLHHVSRKASRMRYWHGDTRSKPYKRKFKRTPQKSGPKCKLTLKEELLLTLMKLRLGIILEVLGGLIWGFSNICIRDFQHMD